MCQPQLIIHKVFLSPIFSLSCKGKVSDKERGMPPGVSESGDPLTCSLSMDPPELSPLCRPWWWWWWPSCSMYMEDSREFPWNDEVVDEVEFRVADASLEQGRRTNLWHFLCTSNLHWVPKFAYISMKMYPYFFKEEYVLTLKPLST